MERSNIGTDGSPEDGNLSRDIIFYRILTRIPVKDLHRFRCVCKPWSNLPRDPLFKSYSHQIIYDASSISSAYNERGFICCKEDYFVGDGDGDGDEHEDGDEDGDEDEHEQEDYFVGGDEDEDQDQDKDEEEDADQDKDEPTTYFFSFLDIDKKECKQIPFQLPGGHYGEKIRNNGAYVSIKDSFNGVLLIRFEIRYTSSQYRYYVYNPACGRWVRICTHSGDGMGDLDYVFHDYSLAYDPIISRYKVVGHDEKFFYIFTVGEDDEWRSVSKPENYTHILGKPVYVNDALHWISMKQNATYYRDILRFDPSKEEVTIIKLPVKGSSASHHRLLEMGGLLWFIRSWNTNYHQLKLWYLKKKRNHNGKHKWVPKCTINMATDIRSQQLISCSGGFSWNREPVVIVTDPILKIIFTFVDKKDRNNRYTYSYDMELKHWDLIHAGPAVCYDNKRRYPEDLDEHQFHYWYDNKNALSTYSDCGYYATAL